MIDRGFQIPENIDAWKTGPYAAWLDRFGPPETAAADIRKKPKRGLTPLLKHMPSIRDRRILNIMGSNGLKALRMANLGARVTVIDASEENAKYCRKTAAAAGIDIEYIVADVLEPPVTLRGFDIAFAELGILHYFLDLKPFVEAIEGFLARGGLFLLHDFHPVSTKLLSYRGSTAKVRKYRVDGDYFDDSLEKLPAPFQKHVSADEEPERFVQWRKWTIGEIVTAFASGTFRIRALVEEPNRSSDVYDRGIPKTFTLVATRE